MIKDKTIPQSHAAMDAARIPFKKDGNRLGLQKRKRLFKHPRRAMLPLDRTYSFK